MKQDIKNADMLTITLEVPKSLYDELEVLFPRYKLSSDKRFNQRLLLEILLTKTLFKALKSHRRSHFNSIKRQSLDDQHTLTTARLV